MSEPVLYLATNALVLVATVLFAIWISRKSRSAEGWSVGGRSLPFIVVLLTQFATASGGGMLVAQVGLGYQFGWGVITYGLFSAGGVMGLIFLAKWLRAHEFISLPDIIKKLYGNHKFLTTIITLMTMVVPFGWLCTQLVAFANLFSTFTGISPTVLAIGFAIVGLIFVLPGGMTSVAWTDALFGGLMLIMGVTTVFFALNSSGGWTEVMATATPERSSWHGFIAPGLLTIALWFMSVLPGTMTNQMYFQRIYAASTLKAVIWSLIGTGILLLGTKFYAAVLGMSAFAMNPDLANPEDAAGTVISQMPLVLAVLYSTFICATLLSTVTSAVQSVVVNITQDLVKSYSRTEIAPGRILSLSRVFSVVILALALVLSLAFPGALNWIVASYAYSAAGLFCPIFLGFALRRTTLLGPGSAVAGVLGGVAGAAIAQIAGSVIPYAMVGLVVSAAAMLVVGAFTPRRTISDQEAAASEYVSDKA